MPKEETPSLQEIRQVAARTTSHFEETITAMEGMKELELISPLDLAFTAKDLRTYARRLQEFVDKMPEEEPDEQEG